MSPPCQPLCLCRRFAMEDSFPPPLGTIPRRHFPPPRAVCRSRASFTLKSGDEAQQQCRSTPQPPSPWPYLPVTAPQPTLHNAPATPERRTPALFPRHLAPALADLRFHRVTCTARHRAQVRAPCFPVRSTPRALLHAGNDAPQWNVLGDTPVNFALSGAFPPEVCWPDIYFCIFQSSKPVTACL